MPDASVPPLSQRTCPSSHAVSASRADVRERVDVQHRQRHRPARADQPDDELVAALAVAEPDERLLLRIQDDVLQQRPPSARGGARAGRSPAPRSTRRASPTRAPPGLSKRIVASVVPPRPVSGTRAAAAKPCRHDRRAQPVPADVARARPGTASRAEAAGRHRSDSKSSVTHGTGRRLPQHVAFGSRSNASSAIGLAVVRVNGVAALSSSRRASSFPPRTRSRSQRCSARRELRNELGDRVVDRIDIRGRTVLRRDERRPHARSTANRGRRRTPTSTTS